MMTRPQHLGRVAVVAVVIAAIAATVPALSTGEDESSTVKAIFTDAMPIVAGNHVKASGVDVGTVESVTLKDGRAVVTMEIEQALRPLHKDARATIKSKNLLGEGFIEIDPGSPGSPVLDEPHVIKENRTKREVDLQDVLNSVDTPTAKSLAALLTTMGEGVHGQGKNVAGAIKALAPAMAKAGELAQILEEQNALLTRLIENAQPVASALAGKHGNELDKLVGSTTTTLSAVAAQRRAAGETLRQLPDTLVRARKMLAQLSGVAEPTTTTLKSLRPVTDDLTDIGKELRAFANAADPALASLQPVLKRGKAMLDEAAPLVRALRPAGDDLRKVSRSGRQLAHSVLGDHLTHLMEFMKGWALATSDYDAISHYFKAMVPVSPSPLGRGVAGPVPGLPDDPAPHLPLPDAPRLPLPGRGEQKVPDAGSATGLTPKQENSMLGQLLGGE